MLINRNIIVSKQSNDFTLLYDKGAKTYYLYYQDEEIIQLLSKDRPKSLDDTLFGKGVKDIDKLNDEETTKRLFIEIQNKIKDKSVSIRTLQNICGLLYSAEKHENRLKEYIEKSNPVIQDKIIQLSETYGKDNETDGIEIEDKRAENNPDDFNKLFNSYDNNWFDMLETELYDYVDNTENVFKGLINALSSLFGYGSRFIVVNGGAEVGKSEYINTIKKLMPDFINLGSSTPASVRRQDNEAFNKKIVYLGDKGLKGTDDEEFKGLQEVFGGLITENEFIREIVVGNDVLKFNLKSDGVCVLYSQPYTNLQVFGAGDQYSTRSTFITVKPVNDGLSVFLQDENKTNNFYGIHKDYIRHILNNPIDLTISDEVKTVIWQSSRDSLRTAKYLLGLFKAYCQYIQVGNPLTTDVMEFLEVFKPKYEVTEIEYMIYERLYKSLYVLKKDEVENKLYEDGTVKNQYLLTQRTNRETKSFFTAKQIKTYFGNEFKRNKNLKDTIDNISDILNNLFKAEYINRTESQYQGQNVYYIPYNKDMQK